MPHLCDTRLSIQPHRLRALAGMLAAALCWLVPCAPAHAAAASVEIPRIDGPPTIEDFSGMVPGTELARRMAKVTGFVQRTPSDGAPASQRTEVYLGYDRDNFYAVFLAFDSASDQIRARLVPRERTDGDDTVTIELDTFADKRRAYGFSANPLGIQTDFFDTTAGGRDLTFDTVWRSRGVLTKDGFVVLMSIPFSSLRFAPETDGAWGIVLSRTIPRASEESWWPRVAASVPSILGQAAELHGISGVTPGRNVQLIPYTSFRSSRELDTRDPGHVRFASEAAALTGGLDSKVVLGGRFVADATINPDFSQVESDDPQATVNARFALSVPEKRPFFLENADFFKTPMPLFFSRQIADPRLGGRLTGKAGPYAIGALWIDDDSPDRAVPDTDPDAGRKATFGIVRVSRDIFDESKVGLLYEERRVAGSFNRIASVDSRLKLGSQWAADLQAATSTTQNPDGTRLAGPAYRAFLRGAGRHYISETTYNDLSAGFRADAGFIPRVDLRALEHYSELFLHPQGKHLLTWSVGSYVGRRWDHAGQLIEQEYDAGFGLELRGPTKITLWNAYQRDKLKPADYPGLAVMTEYPHDVWVGTFQSSVYRQVTIDSTINFGGTNINYVPAIGAPPAAAERPLDGKLTLTVRPVTRLRIDNMYLLTRLRDGAARAGIFNSQIWQTRWNWQFSRELALRATARYETLRTNPALTALERTTRVNGDLLVSYQLNPWTALYVGCNGNGQNLALIAGPNGTIAERSTRGLLDDSRVFFVKFSYLIRP